jgi:monoamine oxidase
MNKENNNGQVHRVKLVILGAGAAGLQCAHSVVSCDSSPNDLLVLEARDRIGGRIYTTHEQRSVVNVNEEEEEEKVNHKNDNGTKKNQNCNTVVATIKSTTKKTYTNNKTATFALDHGACWVHGTGLLGNTDKDGDRNPIMKYLRPSDLTRVFNGNPWTRPKTVLCAGRELALFVDQKRLDNAATDELLREHANLYGAVNQLGQAASTKVTLGTSLQRVIDGLQKQTRKRNSAVPALSFFTHLLECWYGTSATTIPWSELVDPTTDAWTDADYCNEGDYDGPHCTVRRGMQSALEPLLQDGVADRIRLNQAAVKLTYDGTDRVITVETATGMTVQADMVVCTMPVGCLKEALRTDLFEPRLSLQKQDAIAHANMGTYKKVFLTFDRIFWPVQETFIGLVRNCDNEKLQPLGAHLLLNNLWARRGIPCLEAILFAESGIWATHKSTDEIRTAVLNFMSGAMGANVATWCVDCHVTRWEEDPYSRGAYSNMAVGVQKRHIAELRQPEWDRRLVLAGEGTIDKYEGSVHAALMSGANAAENVCKFFGTKQVAKLG